MISENVYKRHGYLDREEYLEAMSADYNLPLDVVISLAHMLGENEDFDGLICALDDAGEY